MKLLPAFLGLTLSVVTAPSLPAVPPPKPPTPAFTVPAAAVATIPDWEARVELARVLSYAHRYPEALAEYHAVLQTRPGDTGLRAEYGQVLGWAGQSNESLAVLSALPRASLPPAAAVLLADLLLGRKDFAESAALYQQALQANPADLSTRFKLARVLAWLKRYDESLAEYRRLLAAAPGDVQLRRHYAQTLGWAGQTEAAIDEWRRTLPSAPAS